ncbi:hypothetical protein F3Y22_tig00111151pilonHSYRG00325 [Hibiscus syriacus]|uniref:Uncharacterized protein n=1 Tax=Hibiscus syriacus TaxID=106335 RepID=A0A6A2YY22_HIBSY|nr:hypothetical protein F3Y22_tig00111151pilonHSYRG00325 [Hibiscus syriacus]
MEFQHFLHGHKLSLWSWRRQTGALRGVLGYHCWSGLFVWRMWRNLEYKSCAELPHQIQKDTFHPNPLGFSINDLFVCDARGRLMLGVINYCCMYCELKLISMRYGCINDENEIAKRAEEEYRPIHHFCHPHQLKRCLFSFTTRMEKEIWEGVKIKCVMQSGAPKDSILYVCLHSCEFFIHECMNEMPRHERSPFHPHHSSPSTIPLLQMQGNMFDVMLVGANQRFQLLLQ